MPKGKLLRAGDRVYNKALGRTLETIANAGNADPFYDGPMSATIISDIKKHGGVMSKGDLKDYEPIFREPLVSKLGDDTVLTAPPPASGPVLTYILNILKGNQSSFRNTQSSSLDLRSSSSCAIDEAI